MGSGYRWFQHLFFFLLKISIPAISFYWRNDAPIFVTYYWSFFFLKGLISFIGSLTSATPAFSTLWFFSFKIACFCQKAGGSIKSHSASALVCLFKLTLYSIDTHFNTSTTNSFWKHCGKRRNCLYHAVSPFPTVFSTQSDNCVPYVHIFDIISLFAAVLEEP